MKKKQIISALLCSCLLLTICPRAYAAKTVTGADAVSIAQSLMGKYPYVEGGKSPSDGGFDCTGLIYYVYHTQLGCDVTWEQIWGRSVPGTKITDKSSLLPGDIIFGLNQKGGWHTALYCGNNGMIHSGSKGVSRTSIDGWFTFKFAIRPSFTTSEGSTLPTDFSVSTDKNSYAVEETVMIIPSANNATHYAISIWLGEFKTGERLYVNYNLPGGITFTPSKAGRYTIRADAKNSIGYISIEKTFYVGQNTESPQIPNYTVTLDANGGNVSPSSITVMRGGTYGTLPFPTWNTPNSYTFIGWYTTAEGGIRVNNDSGLAVDADHTLYAHWNDIHQAVLDPNGGTVSGSSAPWAVKYNDAGNFPVAVRPGYTFDGWYTEKDGGEKISSGWSRFNDGAYFYAHWTPIAQGNYTVTFDSCGGDARGPKSMEVQSGGTYGELPIAFGPAFGDSLIGWFTAPNGGRQVLSGDPLVVNADHTLYAHYRKELYTITFDPNGGTVASQASGYMSSSPQEYLRGAKFTQYGDLSDAVWVGHEFLGWYTDPIGGTQVVNGMDYVVLDDHTLYAHWK